MKAEFRGRACSVKIWCTNVGHISRIVVLTGENWQFDRVTDIITYGLLYLLEKLKIRGNYRGVLFHNA